MVILYDFINEALLSILKAQGILGGTLSTSTCYHTYQLTHARYKFFCRNDCAVIQSWCKPALDTNIPFSSSSLNSVKAKFTLIFSNELVWMRALITCGIAFMVMEPMSFSHAASICSMHAWPSGVVKPVITNEFWRHFTRCGKLEQKCSPLGKSAGCAALHVMWSLPHVIALGVGPWAHYTFLVHFSSHTEQLSPD